MKRFFKVIFLAFLTISLTGCGALIEMRSAKVKFSMEATDPLTESNPLKSDVHKAVKSIVVADFSDVPTIDISPDNLLLYKSMLREVETALKGSKLFTVVPRAKFRASLSQKDYISELALLDDDESIAYMAEIGRELGVHALYVVGFVDQDTGLKPEHFATVLLDGSISINSKITVESYRSKTGELLWSQSSDFKRTAGINGLKFTKASEVRKQLRSIVRPIVNAAIEDSK